MIELSETDQAVLREALSHTDEWLVRESQDLRPGEYGHLWYGTRAANERFSELLTRWGVAHTRLPVPDDPDPDEEYLAGLPEDACAVCGSSVGEDGVGALCAACAEAEREGASRAAHPCARCGQPVGRHGFLGHCAACARQRYDEDYAALHPNIATTEEGEA